VYWRQKEAFAILPVSNRITPQNVLKCSLGVTPITRLAAKELLGDVHTEQGKVVEDRPLSKVQASFAHFLDYIYFIRFVS